MALVDVRFDVAGDRQVSRAFEAFGHEADDLTEPFTAFAADLLAHIAEQFATEGAAGAGGPWQPLEAKYEAWKAAHYPGRPILVQTGAMRAASVDPADVHIEPGRMVYENPDQKAFWHQVGAGHLPARRIVALTEADKRQMVDRTFATWLNEKRHEAFTLARP